jgi:hypothetical protein
MNVSNEQYLESKYYHWVALRDGGFIKDLSNEERQTMLNILRQEWEPKALYCLTCMDDVANMLRNVFTQYDRYKASKPVTNVKKKPR